MKIVWIGAGNLATRVAFAMSEAGLTVAQVYSHTLPHAEALAGLLGCEATNNLAEVRTDADIYLFALKDTALCEAIARVRPNRGIWVHTAGSMPMDLFKGYAEHYGVLYPMQTFSKARRVDVSKVPIFVEGSDAETTERLMQLARHLSDSVHPLSSEKRKKLHLSAVFANNFVNHLYALASDLLTEQDIDPALLLPLIDETAAKVHDMTPRQAQTGPAVRYDENVIQKQLAQLDADPDKRQIYALLSQSIHKHSLS